MFWVIYTPIGAFSTAALSADWFSGCKYTALLFYDQKKRLMVLKRTDFFIIFAAKTGRFAEDGSFGGDLKAFFEKEKYVNKYSR